MLPDRGAAGHQWIETLDPMVVRVGEFLKVSFPAGDRWLRVLEVDRTRVRVVRMRWAPFPIWRFTAPLRRLRRRVENIAYEWLPE